MVRVLHWVPNKANPSRSARRGNTAAHDKKEETPPQLLQASVTDADGWTTVGPKRRPTRASSPTPSAASTASGISTRSAGSSRSRQSAMSSARSSTGSRASTASTVNALGPMASRRRASARRRPLSALLHGGRLAGRVTGVLPYGVFVDVGASKDGMLHASETRWLTGAPVPDMRRIVSVGDWLPLLYVFKVDEAKGQLALTCAPPSEDAKELPFEATLQTKTTLRADKGLGTETDHAQFNTPMVLVGTEAEVAEARPTAVCILKGLRAAPTMLTPAPPRIIAQATVRGKTFFLYDMPWKSLCG